MRSLLLAALVLILVIAGCRTHHGGGGPVPSPFGLDTRPSNATCLAKDRPPSGASVAIVPTFGGLTFTAPVYLLQAPGNDTRWYVVQQDGRVMTFQPGDAAATTFIDVSTEINYDMQEEGLLGMAFAPDFATSGEFFLSYNGLPAFNSNIGRFHSNDGGLTGDAAGEQPVLSFVQPFENHKGGNLQFGADGMLYVGFGDGGDAGDPGNRSQDMTLFFGKMLRLDVIGGSPYAIPADNPYAGSATVKKEIWAAGLRNPWRWSFDRATGDLWAGDVGQDAYEEVDVVQKAGNYGWHVKEATHCYSQDPCTGPFIDPVVEYAHTSIDPNGGNSITGGYVYRGTGIPDLIGTYVYADFVSGKVWALVYGSGGQPAPEVINDGGALSPGWSSFGEGNDGEVYLLGYSDGKIYKLVPNGATGPNNFPQKLSDTGCVDPADARKPAGGVIPYDVNVALWSDGASKQRWMALPDTGTITVGTDGDWNFPIGTVLMKEFSVGGARIETRLLMRHSDGDWAGYTYEWNAAGTDALLLPAGKSKTVGAQTWTYPSRAECLQCHSRAAGRSLGLETAQLNRNEVYPATNRVSNELATLDHIGMFDTPLAVTPDLLPAYPAIDDAAAPLDERARAYLHENCSICHRPGGTNQGTWDARDATAFVDMNVCNAVPVQGDLGVAGARLLVPGDPAHSVISLRMHATDSNRMPQVGTKIVDPVGSAAIDAWITSVAACP